MIFPDRKSLIKNISDGDLDFEVEVNQIEEQKTYTWIRVYLNDEIDINTSTDITIKYLPTNEELQVKFISYNKSLSNKDEEDLAKYSDEEDKKILCCLIDVNKLNNNSDNIPFLRTLFKSSKWNCNQIYRRDDLELSFSNNKVLYYHIDF